MNGRQNQFAQLLKIGIAPGALTLALFALGQTAAQAQEAKGEAQSTDDTVTQEIIVTGTLLRGVAGPVGSNQIVVDEKQVAASGATNSNELLATIPQVTNLFNTVPSSKLAATQTAVQIVRPNLRNLTPDTGSSSSTLVLFDGHRVAGVGVTQSAVDPDLIPAGAIERVEVVTDGGSATYGADAVGGVINFITRKRFDGLKVDARYGFADDYWTVDASVTAGKDWGSGSLFASYSFQENNSIFGRDRDFIRQVDWNSADLTPIGRQCAASNVAVGSTRYAYPNLTTPGYNACDSSDDQSFVPKAVRDGAIVGLHQELSDAVTVDVRAFYGERRTTSRSPLRADATLTSANPYYLAAAANPVANQTVSFNLDAVLGSDAASQGTAFQEWGANAEFTADIDSNWQLRTLFNYSRSNSTYYAVALDPIALAAAGSSSDPNMAVNFYDPAATSNLDLVRALANYETAGQGRDELFNARTILEGRLFALPGGDVRLAAGYEYLDDAFKQRLSPVEDPVRGAIKTQPYTGYNRDVHSIFGELQVPLFGPGNRRPFLYSLVVSGSLRYDHFSDFGSTTNPKIAVTWKPAAWAALRGNYSTSFNAPSPVDQLGSLRNRITIYPFNPFVRPGDSPNVIGALVLQGSLPNLKPQTARTLSFGGDLDPTFVPGLHISANYYKVKFENLLGTPSTNSLIFSNFPDNISTNINGLSEAELRAFAALAPNGASVLEPILAGGRGIYETVNFLTGNYGTLRVDGIDFVVNYRHPVSFGLIDASISGNRTLSRKSQVSATAPVVDALAYDVSPLQLQASLGANIGRLRAQATLNHSQGYDVVRTTTLPQDHVGDFNTVNLFFKYDMPGDSKLLKDLSITLNVNNAFDQDPPVYKLSTQNGYANGFTLGRLVMFGISKQF